MTTFLNVPADIRRIAIGNRSCPTVDMGLKVFDKYEAEKSNIGPNDWSEFWEAKAAGDPIEIKLLEADEPEGER